MANPKKTRVISNKRFCVCKLSQENNTDASMNFKQTKVKKDTPNVKMCWVLCVSFINTPPLLYEYFTKS